MLVLRELSDLLEKPSQFNRKNHLAGLWPSCDREQSLWGLILVVELSLGWGGGAAGALPPLNFPAWGPWCMRHNLFRPVVWSTDVFILAQLWDGHFFLKSLFWSQQYMHTIKKSTRIQTLNPLNLFSALSLLIHAFQTLCTVLTYSHDSWGF